VVPAWVPRRFGTADSKHTHTRTPDAHAHADDTVPDAHADDTVADPNARYPVADAHTHNPISDPNAAAGIAHAAIHQHADLTVTHPATGNASATRSGLSIRGGGIRNRRVWPANQRRHGAH
jgi:hypothetical protein